MSVGRVIRADQPKPATRMATVRLRANGYLHIVARARRCGVDVSTMHRRMLAYAAEHMPDGYRSPTERENWARRPAS